MEKVIFQSPQDGEALECYIIEQTRINGVDYLLVTEEEEGDCEAFILKDLSEKEEEEAMYEMVEYISRIFSEILEDVDFTI